MKKQINIIFLLILTVLLSSCITSQDDVNKAKQNLWIIEWWSISMNSEKEEVNVDILSKDEENENWSWIIQDTIDQIENDIIIEEKEKIIEIKSLTEKQLLKLDNISEKKLLTWEIEITGTTLWKVDKIIVTYKNETSDFPDDVFQLKKFASGDQNFLYRAFSRYETLDFWKNIYLFEAYSWDEITKLELTLNVKREDERKLSEKTEQIYEQISISELPSNEKFWHPTELWNGKISYSDLNWLEIKRNVKPELTCKKVTSVLADDVSWYFYWNTCRPIEKDEWISFFVVRLDWDKYIYEKHYYLSYQWLYWIQELETWTWVTSISIWEKNTELKARNADFGILEITDDLFKEILK